ncbi:hypothetical protein J6590_017714 [Homalodisca vitripennis]|nr:hypothetical protein J6590_017714 [Homalodisca vitripennis]
MGYKYDSRWRRVGVGDGDWLHGPSQRLNGNRSLISLPIVTSWEPITHWRRWRIGVNLELRNNTSTSERSGSCFAHGSCCEMPDRDRRTDRRAGRREWVRGRRCRCRTAETTQPSLQHNEPFV